MYEAFYGLKERPFENTPNPAFFYGSQHHREALASLVYGVKESKGFMLVTGDVGTGKTFLIQALKNEIAQENEHIILEISTPWITPEELFNELPANLGMEAKADWSSIAFQKDLRKKLIEVLKSGRRVVIVLDEAQQLPERTIEGVRLLSNLETEQAKLIQIIMLGQTELHEILNKHSMRQIRQRIAISRTLSNLSRSDTEKYIAHRIAVAGNEETLFEPSSMDLIFRASNGSPRLINLICDNCLITGFAKRKATIDHDIVKEVVDDLPLPSNVMLQEESNETPVQRTSVLAHLADTDHSHEERPESPVEAPVKVPAKGLKSLLPESSVESQSYQEQPRATSREASATREAFEYQQRQNRQQSRVEEPVRAEHSPPPPRVVIQKAKVPWLGFLLIAVLSAFFAFAAAYVLLGKGKEPNAVASTDAGVKQQSMTDQIKQAIDNSQTNMRAGQVDNPARQIPEESTIGLTEYHNTSADQYLSPQDRYNHLDTPRPMVNDQNQQLTYNVNAVIDSPQNADDIRRKWGFDTESGEVTTRPEVRSNSAPIPQPMIESQPVSAMQVDNSSSAVNRQAAQDDKVSSPVEIMISRPQDKRRMPNGGTISQLARSKYSTWNDTVRDIVITANPELGGDLNLLRAHQEVVLPTISRDDLVVRSQNGYWYVFVASYISKSRAMQQQQRLYSAGDVSVAQLSDSYGQNIYRLFLGPYDGLAHAVNRARLYEFEEMPFVR